MHRKSPSFEDIFFIENVLSQANIVKGDSVFNINKVYLATVKLKTNREIGQRSTLKFVFLA